MDDILIFSNKKTQPLPFNLAILHHRCPPSPPLLLHRRCSPPPPLLSSSAAPPPLLLQPLLLLHNIENAQKIAEFLASHPLVKKVNYAGLPSHPGYALHYSQAEGGGSVLSFETGSLALSKYEVENTKYFGITVSFAGSFEKRNVLLVIAHPDDESMFFSPTINHFTATGHHVHILCLSTGNADGIGDVRKQELYRASEILKVPVQQVTVMDHPEFQDGFGKVWNSSILSKIVEEKVLAHEIDMILTFDNYGVSGHCNHRDVNHGVRRFMLDTSQQEIETWELVSINIIRKYSGPIDIWFSLWSSRNSSNGQIKCLLNDNPRRSYVAMSQHLSQWVWFRKLFVSFSSYTYVNTLRKISK